MTFLDAIEEANNKAGIYNLSFANIKEFNAFLDSFQFEDFPRNVVVPFDNNGRHIGAIRKGTIPLQGWVLTRITDEPLDLRSVKAEREYVRPMRALAIKFINRLLDSDVIDPEESDGVTDSIRPEYAFLSAHLFGVSYQCNIPIVETIECCDE